MLYCLPVTATNPGEIVDSKIPRKNRTVASPANEAAGSRQHDDTGPYDYTDYC